MDSIEISGLRFYAHHGVMPQETLVGNEFEVDIRLDLDASSAMTTDSLDTTVNYAEAIELVAREMSTPSRLLEHVAGRIRRRLSEAYPQTAGGMVRVSKLAPPIPRQLTKVSFTTFW